MLTLGIETSCDETAVAVVEGVSPTLPIKVLSSVVASSEEMHVRTGGIVPEVAAREQLRSIIPVIQEALVKAQKQARDMEAIAVTVGPGLIGSLLVGVETAKILAYVWGKSIIPVNHLIAHLYANWLGQEVPEFPAVGLVVSGGHTDLVLMEGHPSTSSGQAVIKLLGRTRDDAAGECFDKGARLLGLPYPGGPAVAKMATKFQETNHKIQTKLPRPMINDDNYDFSFSGLKTALRSVRQAQDKLAQDKTAELAYELQEAIAEVLVAKVVKAVEEFKPKSVLLGGGVAANSRLRQLLELKMKNEKCKVYIPEPKLCTDNAASIAAVAYYNCSPIPWQSIKVDPSLEIV